MRRAIYLAVVVSTCLAVLPTTADAHRHARRAAAQPTSVELFGAMLTAADEWWSQQGSPPPCPYRADVQWGGYSDGIHEDFGVYHSCTIIISPHWWAVQYAFVTGRARRWQRIRAAAFDLAMLMHERGHNIGFEHIAGTVMDAGAPVVPGWAFEWAERTVR